MRTVIKQSVELPARPETLFDMYMTSKSHAAFTGEPAKIGKKPGSPFTAFDGTLSGTLLAVVPKRLIVQTWRSSMFRTTDPDSTLYLSFSRTPKGGRIDLVHLDVPEHDYDGVNIGWRKYYWTPWRRYLTKR